MHLVEHQRGTVELSLAKGRLRTRHIVVGAQDGTLVSRQFLVLDEVVKEHAPLDGQLLQALIVVLVVEHVAVVGIQVGNERRQRPDVPQQGQPLLVGRGALVQIVHVGIDVAHRVVGDTHAVLVITPLGIVEHGLHLAQRYVVLALEDVGVGQLRPYLVVVLPVAQRLQCLHVARHVVEDGVGQVVVIEQHGTLNHGHAPLLVVGHQQGVATEPGQHLAQNGSLVGQERQVHPPQQQQCQHSQCPLHGPTGVGVIFSVPS